MNRHESYMQQALQLAERARVHAPPNPWVGCVIIKDGQVIGQGYTQPPGQFHAEICALKEANEKAKDATLYVTLEPCAHYGRTPPCVDALIQAGIREVYIGIEDPDTRVKGRGIAALQNAGIQVFSGICEAEIKHQLAPYLYQRQTGLPYTLLKSAISIDGRTAAADQSSQWITTSEALEDVHLLRASSQAIIIGARTALKDNPRLTVRHPACTPHQNQQPLRVLLDAKGIVPAKGPLFDTQLSSTLVITTALASKDMLREWEKTGAEVVIVSGSEKGVDLHETWKLLGSRSILQILVEGGSHLHSALLETTLFQRLIIYIGPILMGSSAYPLYHSHIPSLQNAVRLSLQDVTRLGECVRLDYIPK